jgi:structural maintenance of chromosome 2
MVSKAARDKAAAKLTEERATLTRYDNELAELQATIKHRKKEIADFELQIQKHEHEVAQLQKEHTAAKNLIANLEKTNDWIHDEKAEFNKADGPFDFAKYDIGKLRDEAHKLEEQQRGMKKKINPKAMEMLER